MRLFVISFTSCYCRERERYDPGSDGVIIVSRTFMKNTPTLCTGSLAILGEASLLEVAFFKLTGFHLRCCLVVKLSIPSE